MYALIVSKLERFVGRAALFKHGFNWSPMYSRSTGRIRSVSEDLRVVEVEIPLTWRNVNYVGTMFGGAMLSATDPILMIQLMHILGRDYVVWDKAVQLRFRKPGSTTLSVTFSLENSELESIRDVVRVDGETIVEKTFELLDRKGDVVASGVKTIFVASKQHFQAKRASKQSEESPLASPSPAELGTGSGPGRDRLRLTLDELGALDATRRPRSGAASLVGDEATGLRVGKRTLR